MTLIARFTPAALAACVAALATAPTYAQALRTFVASYGSDANACTRVSPCRTLQIAHDKTAIGGELNIVDPAGYGALVITKSISVTNDGAGSTSILVPAGVDGITINDENAVVNIRGLTIEGAGIGSSGIAIIHAKSVTIQHCKIRNLVNHGIVATLINDYIPLAISDTYIANNGGLGIVLQPNYGGSLRATLNRVEVYNNVNTGVALLTTLSFNSSRMTVIDSISANNGLDGFATVSGDSLQQPFSTLRLIRSTATNNGQSGLYASGFYAYVELMGSTLSGNVTPYTIAGGATARTYGDNYMEGAGGALLTFPKH